MTAAGPVMTAPPAVPVAATVACATQRGTMPAYTEPPGITHCPPGHCTCGGTTECAGCGNTTFQLPHDGPPTCAACGTPAGAVTP